MADIRVGVEGDVASLGAVEERAATLFRDVGLAAAVDLPLHDPSALRVACREGRVLVAVDATDAPIGFAIVEAHPDGDVHLLELDVLPEHGGKGLGRALIAAAEDWGRRRGLGRITLTTFRDVPFNAPFYARVGFVVLEGSAVGGRLGAILAAEVAHGIGIAPRVAMAKVL